MITEPSPFRKVWIALGKLREYLELENDPQGTALYCQLLTDIERAEGQWQWLNRGPGLN